MSELLPCPFCGGAPVLRETMEHYAANKDGPADSYSAWFNVACDHCGIEIGEEYKSTAIAAWNRRPSPAAGWQPIETLPPRVYVLAFHPHIGPYVEYSGTRHGHHIREGYTHWMPLPAPPGSPAAGEPE